MSNRIIECVEKLMPADGVLLIISDKEDDGCSAEHWKGKYKITRAVLSPESSYTDSTSYPAPLKYYLPLQTHCEDGVDIVCLSRFPLESSNPLDILTYVANVLRPGGFFLCYLHRPQHDAAITQGENQIDYLIAIASRCGLIIPPDTDLAFDQKDITPLVFQKRSVMPRWQLGHLSDPGFTCLSKLFRDSFDLEPIDLSQ